MESAGESTISEFLYVGGWALRVNALEVIFQDFAESLEEIARLFCKNVWVDILYQISCATIFF